MKTAIQVNSFRWHVKTIADGGGKYVAGGFNKTVAFSGEPPPNRVVIIQFENMDKAKAWCDSPAQKDSHKSAISSRLSASLLLKASNKSNFPQRGSEPRCFPPLRVSG
jgi:uncharacterized protein (DUF1330 family)